MRVFQSITLQCLHLDLITYKSKYSRQLDSHFSVLTIILAGFKPSDSAFTTIVPS